MVMIVLRKSVAVLLLLCGTAVLSFAAADGNFDRTLKVTGAVDLEVSTGSGNITVKTGAGDAVVVHGYVRVNDNWFAGGDAHDKVNRIVQNPPIEQNGNAIRIGRIDDPELRRNVTINYDVVVPAQTRVGAKTGSGDETIDGIRGELEA